MRTIETQATLTPDGTLTARVPADIPPGEHQVVIVIDAQQVPPTEQEPLRFSAYPVGLVSDDITFRREDLYDDAV